MKKYNPKDKQGKRKTRVVEVDFTGVDTRVLIPEGDYLLKIKSLEVKKGEDSGKNYIEAKWAIKEGEYKGQTLFDNLSLQPQALFKLKTVLVCSGLAIPKSINKLNLDELEEQLEVGATIYHDLHEGKKRAKVSDYFPPEDFEESDEDEDEGEETEVEVEEEDEEEEEEQPATKKSPKSKKKAKPEPEPEEEEEEEDDSEEEEDEEEEIDLDAMSLSDLKKFAKENGIKIPVSAKKDAEKLREAILEAVGGEDEDEEEDED